MKQTHDLSRAAMMTRRDWLQAGALVVGFCFAPAAVAQAGAVPPQPLALDEVDSFLAVRGDGTVVVHSGKVDLGTGHRIAMRQMVGEELGIGVDRIELIEGDSALTPNQGPTAGSSGIARGGVELRQAAATAREALLAMAAQQLQRPASSRSPTARSAPPMGAASTWPRWSAAAGSTSR
jgi:nicotinate dehydrogenase subunit B